MSLKDINKINSGTLMEKLLIEYIEVSEGRVVAKMPVCKSTQQPEGILHGGASLALAETVAGLGSLVLIDSKEYSPRGSQVSANHVGSAMDGDVYAYADIIHKGRNTHVWNIDVKTSKGKLVSTCRVTNIIVKKQ